MNRPAAEITLFHQIVKPIQFWILLIPAVLIGFIAAAADLTHVKIEGQYGITQGHFDGFARFTIPPSDADRLLFHLPPAWYTGYDNRVEYQLRIEKSGTQKVLRDDLIPIEPPTHKNLYLPQGIQIKRVYVNERPASFQILNNPKLLPSKNSIHALLEVSTASQSHSSPSVIRIEFKSRFHQLPSGYKRILWDFIPRPVGYHDGQWDFRSQMAPVMKQNAVIQVFDASGIQFVHQESTVSPFSCIHPDKWSFKSDGIAVSYDSYFEDTRESLMFRIHHVVKFLKKYHAFQGKQVDWRVILWDGPLTVSGMTVLLPRRLFRYPIIFYKQYEVVLLKGLVAALLHSRFNIDSSEHPWIVPAIQGEVIRQYFKDRFKGNTHIFPWLDWLNPEYFSDATVRPWVENQHQKVIISADLPVDLSYYAHIYHPGFEKGFHLLWILHSGEADYRDRQIKRIFELLAEPAVAGDRLTPQRFWELFTVNEDQKRIGERWLSEEGRIDYAITGFDTVRAGDQYRTQVTIENLGTVSPVLEIGFYFEDSRENIRTVEKGAGTYEFFFDEAPTQAILDPSFRLLDDNPVNNRWRFPIKTRLVWDFPPPDNWLITISPLVGEGNTFDRNILGFNLTANYLTRTEFQLNFWTGADSDLLWSSGFSHKGYPFHGSELYLKAGYLAAVNSTSLGIKHETFKEYPDLWIDFSIWRERLDDLDDPAYTDEQLDWAGVSASSAFPIIEVARHVWKVDITARAANSLFQPSREYQQVKIDQLFQYDFGSGNVHLGMDQGFSSGEVPLQRKYPMGGTEGLSGFPREESLLFDENRIFEIGITFPGMMAYTDLNLLGLMWLHQVVPTLDYHYGQGRLTDSDVEAFSDIELSISFRGEFINRFLGEAHLAVAQPLGHEKYKDYRIILFSDWVF